MKPTLVIMAAGLGSRFGGAKQITPIDDEGQLIIDYSIYDAMRAGFGKVVCVIKEEAEADFRARIGDRIAPHLPIEYAYQRLGALPAGFSVPEGREKPWGTAHAVLCAKDIVDTPFAVINADDFYGRTAISAIYDFLSAKRAETEHAMVGYLLKNTLSEAGSVARGVCETDDRDHLTGVVERTHIEKRPGGAAFTEDGERFIPLSGDTVVSLNLWGFQRSIFGEIERRFSAFLDANLPANPLKCEYFLPLIPNQLISEGAATVRVLETDEKWYGVTYREDMPIIQAAIAQMKKEGVYPINLWRK